MKKRFIAVAMTAVMAAFAFAGCSSSGSTESSGADASAPAEAAEGLGDEVINIGGIGPLTGNVSNYGVAAMNGAKLAIEQAKADGMNVEFICEDDKGDTQEATNAYEKLTSTDKIVALVGAVTSNPTIAVAQIAAQDNLPMISPSATADEVTAAGSNVFRACFTDPFQGEIMAKYASEKLSAKTAAILYDSSDPYSEGLMKSFEETAATVGIEIVAKESYTNGDVDFKSQLTKIGGVNPDVLFLPVYYQDVAQIATQAKQAGIASQLLGADGWEGVVKQLGSNGTDVVEGALFCCQFSSSSEDESVVNFVKAYEEAYGETPSQFAALGYDAAMIVIESIKTANSTDSQAIIDAMAAIEYDGLTGKCTFDENGTPIKTATITTIEGGDYKVVEDYQ